ncbi:hypothetical protein MKW92_017431 [Papaver armeniacum]|nr:hypothetical protein MKW92_017431 [Papaver armeniacum]
MEKSCSSLIHFDKGTPALDNEIKESFEGSDVVAKVDMILICQNLRNNLQHPNEYMRGVTLRFLCRLSVTEIIKPLIPSILANLEHLMSIYKLLQVEQLLVDAPEVIEKALSSEQDPSAKRNVFLVFFTCAQEREINYLRTHVNSIPEWGETNRGWKGKYIKIIISLLNAPSNASDSSVKLIVLDRLNELKTSHREIMVDMITDVLMTIDIALELITPRNIDEVVQALKKIVVKTQSTELEKNGEYRQMLIVVHLLMDCLGDSNVASAIDMVVFVHEIIETNPKLVVAIMTRLLDTFSTWIQYCSFSEVENGLAPIKQCLGDLPFFTVNEGGGGADTSKPSQQVNSISVSYRRPAILADGTYATQSAASEIALSPPTFDQGSLASPGYLRSLNITGDFSLEQLEEVQPSKPEVNKASSQALLVMVSMLQLGQSSFLPHLVDNDAYDRIVLCIRLLCNTGDEIRKIWLHYGIFHAQPDDLIDFYHLKSRKGMSQLEVEDEVQDDLKRATGEFTKDGDDLPRLSLKHMLQFIITTLYLTSRRSIVLNEIHIDIMNYISPATCADVAFRTMWAEFEWENKEQLQKVIWSTKQNHNHIQDYKLDINKQIENVNLTVNNGDAVCLYMIN